MIPYRNCAYFSDLYNTLMQCFPDTSATEAKDILRQLILAPAQDKININGAAFNKIQIIDKLRQNINAENNSEPFEKRYNQLLEATLKIIKHMNDGYITAEDYQERNAFLERINQKEFLLFVLLALIKSHPEMQNDDIDKQLRYKISSLRELNDLISRYTRNTAEIKTEREDYEKAKIIYKMLKSLQSLGYGYTISRKERQNLGIDHEDDEDLCENFAFQDWLKRLMLLQLRREERIDAAYESNTLEDISQNDEKFGYSTTFFDDVNARISELRGTLKKRTFDSRRYNMLEEAYVSDMDAHEL